MVARVPILLEISHEGIPNSHFLVQKHVGLHVKSPLLLFEFNQNLTVSTNFTETPPNQIQ